MLTTISNDLLTVTVDSLGAQLRGISTADGTQLLWQGDRRWWGDSAPVLFPYIGRLWNGEYSYCGAVHKMGIHGFAAKNQFTVEEHTGSSVTLVLRENESTLQQYPFRFVFSVEYTLSGAELKVLYHVENLSGRSMPFAVGGHPGFNVPFCEGTEFGDYYLRFGEKCLPDLIGFTSDVLVSGEYRPYPLLDGDTIPLSHSLFDDDSVILQNMAKSVTLGCRKTGRKLTVSYPGMRYLGFWHMPRTEAPYVCIEPWTSLPSRQGVVEELTCKSDLVLLAPGEVYDNGWSVLVEEA